MRVAVLGSCQSPVIRDWIMALIPSANATAWHVNIDASSTPEALASVIDGFDLVITQFADGTGYGPLEVSKLRARHNWVVHLPIFIFPGFQPDLAVVTRAWFGGALLQGPLGTHMSSIVVAAFFTDIPVRRVPGLLNRLVTASLGFGRQVEISRVAVERVFAEAGYDLRGQFDAWIKRGPFMYTDNHPHARVLGTLTRMALQAAGLNPAHELDVPEVDDLLAHSLQWPIYPGVWDQALGDDRVIYVRSQYHIPLGERRELPALEFAMLCYEVLDQGPRETFALDAKTVHAIEVIEGLSELLPIDGPGRLRGQISRLQGELEPTSMGCLSCGTSSIDGPLGLCGECKAGAALGHLRALDRRRNGLARSEPKPQPFMASGPLNFAGATYAQDFGA